MGSISNAQIKQQVDYHLGQIGQAARALERLITEAYNKGATDAIYQALDDMEEMVRDVPSIVETAPDTAQEASSDDQSASEGSPSSP